MPAAKALITFIMPIILSPLVIFGIQPDTTVEAALSILLGALISAATVYFVPNKV